MEVTESNFIKQTSLFWRTIIKTLLCPTNILSSDCNSNAVDSAYNRHGGTNNFDCYIWLSDISKIDYDTYVFYDESVKIYSDIYST